MSDNIIEIPLEDQMDNIRTRWEVIGERFKRFISLRNELTTSKSIDFPRGVITLDLTITQKNAQMFVDFVENIDQVRKGIDEVMRLSQSILESPNLTEEGKFFAQENLKLRTTEEIIYIFDYWENNFNSKKFLEAYAKCKQIVGERINENIVDLSSENPNK
jgi:hypothetical protein